MHSLLSILLFFSLNFKVLQNNPGRTIFEVEFKDSRTSYAFLALPGEADPSIKSIEIIESTPDAILQGVDDLVRVERKGKIREIPLALLRFNPLLKTEGGNVKVKKARVEIEYTGGSSFAYYVSPSFIPLYRKLFINSSHLILNEKKSAYKTINGARYLIICDDAFVDELEPLKDWKTRKGMYARIVPLSVTGTSSSDIKAYIEDAYFNWDTPPEYVLLVGDPNIIPSPYTYNDHYYAMLDGDVFDDVVIGRLPAETEADVSTMVAKILGYEETPYLEDTTWFIKGTVIVREDHDEDDAIYWGDVEFAAQKMVEAGYIHVDTFSMDQGDDYLDVENAITEGRTYVLYRGQGVGNWWSPFNINPANTNNGFKLPVIISTTCSTLGDDDLGETSMTAGTADSPKCAVGFIGTTTIRTNAAYIRSYIARGFFKSLFEDSLFHFGQALNGARLYLYENLGEDEDYYGFVLLGDPDLNLWTSSPGRLYLTAPPTLPPGTTQVVIHVDSDSGPAEGALVCIMTDTLHYSYGYTDANGDAVLNVVLPDTGEALITVTHYNSRPKTGYISIGVEGPYVGVGSTYIHDAGNNDGNINPAETITLDITLKNYGTETAYGVNAILIKENGKVTLVDSTQYIGTIPAQDSVFLTDAFTFNVADDAEDGDILEFALLIFDSNGDTWTNELNYTVYAPRIEFGDYVIIDSIEGNMNGIPESGETFLVLPEIKNSGGMGISDLSLELLPMNLNPLVNILDGSILVDSLSAGSSVQDVDKSYTIELSHLTPPVYNVRLKVVVRGITATYTYNDTFNFVILANPPNIHFPSGPDEYGYYAYDNEDVFYGRPEFEWIEIAPPQGQGTIIPEITDSDADTVTIPLPFTFKFYGVEYDSIGISSNGFMELGRSTYRFGYNSSIPSPGGPRRLISPFWCDLNPAEGGDIYSYYDEENHRFIIEFKEVVHYGGNYPETFEVILLDPAYHTTPTGDGIIIFQYDSVSYAGECTVGIEDHTETIGLQYLYNGQYANYAAPLESGRAIAFTTQPLNTNPYPWMSLEPPYQVIDTLSGNGNGLLEPGETAFLYIYVNNGGTTPLENVVGTLRSLEEGIIFHDSTANYGTIPPSSSLPNIDPFIVELDNEFNDTLINLELYLHTSSGNFILPLTIPVELSLSTVEMSVNTDYLKLLGPVPSPGVITVEFGLSREERVTLSIYDVAGRKVKTLMDGIAEAGIHEIQWNGRDESGRKVASGIYFLKFRAGKSEQIHKIIMLQR